MMSTPPVFKRLGNRFNNFLGSGNRQIRLAAWITSNWPISSDKFIASPTWKRIFFGSDDFGTLAKVSINSFPSEWIWYFRVELRLRVSAFSINIIVSKYPEEKEELAVKKGLDVMTIKLERVFPESKNNNFLPSYFASTKAKENKKDDAIFQDRFGHVTEATTGNIFFFKDKVLFTTSSKILKGVTRKVIILYAKQKNIKVVEKMFNLGELLDADEVFMSGTTKLIVPVIKINDKKISSGKPGFLTLKLRKELTEYLFSKENEFTEDIGDYKNRLKLNYEKI